METKAAYSQPLYSQPPPATPLSLSRSITLTRPILWFPIYPRYPSHPTSFAKKLWKPFMDVHCFSTLRWFVPFFPPHIRKEDREKSSKRSHLSWLLVIFWEKWNLVLHAGRLCWYSLSLIWIYLVPLSVSAVSCTRYEQDLMEIA